MTEKARLDYSGLGVCENQYEAKFSIFFAAKYVSSQWFQKVSAIQPATKMNVLITFLELLEKEYISLSLFFFEST